MSQEADPIVAEQAPQVYVEVVDTRTGERQISARPRLATLVSERRADIEAAISTATAIALGSLEKSESQGSWRLSEMEFAFGIKLGVDAGVIVSKLSAEASLDVTLRLSRT